MNLVLLQEWMDHPEGSKLALTDTYAKVLIERGTAKEDKEEVKEKEIIDNESKDISEAPADKMVKVSKRK